MWSFLHLAELFLVVPLPSLLLVQLFVEISLVGIALVRTKLFLELRFWRRSTRGARGQSSLYE